MTPLSPARTPIRIVEDDDLRLSGAKSSVELTILMPCLNEARTIGICIYKAKEFMARAGVSGEVLVADNGSVDGSIDIALSMGARVVQVEDRGYGAALIGGIAEARGEFIIMGDADDSYDFESLDPFLEKLRAGDRLVMGNRFKGGIAPGAMPMLHYYLGNPVLSAIGKLFFSIPVSDFHCGLRGFHAETIRKLNLRTTGMEFASEMVVRSSLAGLQISEVPTTLRPDGRGRPPHLRTWRDGWRHLKFLLMYSPQWLYLVPGAVLTIIGALLALALCAGPVSLGPNLALDVNSFAIACVMTVVGHQIVSFGLMARYYAILHGMLPRPPEDDFILQYCKTDRMLLVAVGILFAGTALIGAALFQWASVNFGNLNSAMPMRLTIGGLSLVLIALQSGLSAFMFGIFDIPLNKAKSGA